MVWLYSKGGKQTCRSHDMRKATTRLFLENSVLKPSITYTRIAGHLVWLLGHDLYSGEISSQAASLVYSTLIAIVPLLAIGASVLKVFGASGFLQPSLGELLKPLGPEGALWVSRTSAFVSHVRVGLVGALGMLFLLVTAFSLLRKIEAGLNVAWQIASPRSMTSRAFEYLALLVIGPVFLLAAFSLTTLLQNQDITRALGDLAPILGRLLPYVIAIMAFTLVNLVTPNARIQLKSALIAGLAGGIAWQTSGIVFALLVSNSTKLATIYSSFAVVILSLLWINLSWTILLLGGRLAYYIQNPSARNTTERFPYLGPRSLEQLAIAIMVMAQDHFKGNGEPLKTSRLAQALMVPETILGPILTALAERHLLYAIEIGTYVIARDPAQITLADIVIAAQGHTPQPLAPLWLPDAFYKANARRLRELSRLTLHDLGLRPS